MAHGAPLQPGPGDDQGHAEACVVVSLFLAEEAERLQKRREELKVADDLVEFGGLSLAVVVRLGENDVKTLEDFADLASDELIEYVGDADNMTMDQANDLIMDARRQLGWFEGLEEEVSEDAEEGEDA